MRAKVSPSESTRRRQSRDEEGVLGLLKKKIARGMAQTRMRIRDAQSRTTIYLTVRMTMTRARIRNDRLRLRESSRLRKAGARLEVEDQVEAEAELTRRSPSRESRAHRRLKVNRRVRRT